MNWPSKQENLYWLVECRHLGPCPICFPKATINPSLVHDLSTCFPSNILDVRRFSVWFSICFPMIFQLSYDFPYVFPCFSIGFSILSPIQTPVSATGHQGEPEKSTPSATPRSHPQKRKSFVSATDGSVSQRRTGDVPVGSNKTLWIYGDGTWWKMEIFHHRTCSDLAWNHQTWCNMICLKQEIQWCGFDWLYIIICENLSSPNQDLGWFTKQNMDLTVCMHVYIYILWYHYIYIYTHTQMSKQLITNFTRSGFKHDWYAWRNIWCLTNNNDQVCGLKPQLVVIFMGKMMKTKPHARGHLRWRGVSSSFERKWGADGETPQWVDSWRLVGFQSPFRTARDVFVGPNVLSGNLFHSYGKWPCFIMFYQSSCWSSINGPSSSIFAMAAKKNQRICQFSQWLGLVVEIFGGRSVPCRWNKVWKRGDFFRVGRSGLIQTFFAWWKQKSK